MTKRIIIIHQWSGGADKDFIPWLVNELKNEYEVVAPQMPDADNPKIEPWLNKLKEILKELRPDDLFIGHSIGCQAILRYLEQLPDNLKINKVILIAPWVKLTNLEDDQSWQIAKPWLETPINFEKVKSRSDSFVAFFSKDDPYVPFEENSQFFKEKLGAKVLAFDSMGHFTKDDGVIKIPEILQYL